MSYLQQSWNRDFARGYRVSRSHLRAKVARIAFEATALIFMAGCAVLLALSLWAPQP